MDDAILSFFRMLRVDWYQTGATIIFVILMIATVAVLFFEYGIGKDKNE